MMRRTPESEPLDNKAQASGASARASTGGTSARGASARKTTGTSSPFDGLQGDPPASDELAGGSADDIDALLKEIEGLDGSDELVKARAEADELRDRYLRLQAEWDNFRKRTNLEREAERGRAAARLVEKLLPVIDDLERAIGHSETTSASALQDGVQAVYTKFLDALNKEGVIIIDPLGEPFDTHRHSAVGVAADASLDEETVVQVYQKGFEMAGRILRPAMVIVSTK